MVSVQIDLETDRKRAYALGSMWMSEICRTLRRSPLGCFGGGSGFGFGFANQLVRLSGTAGGIGHRLLNLEHRFLYPTRP